MSLKISKSERRQILEQHQSLKNVLLKGKVNTDNTLQEQQAAIGTDKINKAIQVCRGLKGAQLGTIKNPTWTNGQKYAAAIVGDKFYTTLVHSLSTPNDPKYTFFVVTPYTKPDGTSGSKITSNDYWYCKGVDAAAPNTQAQTDDIKKYTDANWKERKDIGATDAQVYDKNLYDQIKIGNTVLFRLKANQQSTGNDQQQTDALAPYVALGGTQTPTNEQSQYWKQLQIPGSERYFGKVITMWFPPNKITNAAAKAAELAGKEAGDQRFDAKTCKGYINQLNQYFEERNTTRVAPSTIEFLRDAVSACGAQHYGKGDFNDFGASNKILDKLRGKGNGGPLSDSPYRINF